MTAEWPSELVEFLRSYSSSVPKEPAEVYEIFRCRDTVSGGSNSARTRQWIEEFCARHSRPSPLDPPRHPCVHEVRIVFEWPDGREYHMPWRMLTAAPPEGVGEYDENELLELECFTDEEAERLRRSREQARNGQRRPLREAMPDV